MFLKDNQRGASQVSFFTGAIAALCLIAILIAGGIYAKKNYQAPEAPPVVVNTRLGPVVLEDNAIAPGALLTAPDLGSIYYLNEDMERVVFPDEQTFLSWYPTFDEVQHVSREKLESFPLSGRNATIRPGTFLVTIQSSPQVWVVSHPNDLHWMQGGEEQAIEIFGENWSERVVDLPEYYFGNYNEKQPFERTDAFPTGLLIHVKSNDQYYVVTDFGQRVVTEEGLKANNFQTKFAIERDEPIVFDNFGPLLDSFEPKYGSPDPKEQAADPGPDDIDTGGATTEAS